MLPDKVREEFAEQVRKYFGDDDPKLRSAALWLQDAGIAESEIMTILGDAWSAGYSAGYGEGMDDATSEAR
ncbi:MAG TPA: hypothetical protein VIY48_14410 [Candidatus Paceibacterota bacterium]